MHSDQVYIDGVYQRLLLKICFTLHPRLPLLSGSLHWTGVHPALRCVHAWDTENHDSQSSPFRTESGPFPATLSLINLAYEENQN